MHQSSAEHDSSLLKNFIDESQDTLDQVDLHLSKIEGSIAEKQPFDLELIHEIFRGFHSLKGLAGFLNFHCYQKLTHTAESMLDSFRKNQTKITPAHIDWLFQASDCLKFLTQRIQEHQTDKGNEQNVERLADAVKTLGQIQVQRSGHSTVILHPNTAAKMNDRLLDHPLSENERLTFQNAVLLLDEIENVILDMDTNNNHPWDSILTELQKLQHFLNEFQHEQLCLLCRFLNGIIAKGELTGKNIAGHTRGIFELITILRESFQEAHQKNIRPQLSSERVLEVMERLVEIPAGHTSSNKRNLLGDLLVSSGKISRDQLDVALAQQKRPLGEILMELGFIQKEMLEESLAQQSTQFRQDISQTIQQTSVRQNLRVDVGKLDQLMDLTGQLTITENIITHHPLLLESELKKDVTEFQRVCRQLREVVASLRMVQVSSAFRTMERLIRDVSRKLQKKVILHCEGEDTELDKNVIDKLSNPLVHILRNALDHGIEPAEIREAQGKPVEGSIWLSAFQESSNVFIEIADDGKGLKRELIAGKALEKGLVTREVLAEMSDQAVFQLIFLPGFSTAKEVTDLSGRGVGMDVVKRSVEELGGTISIYSEVGRGTTFTLQLPLTLSIIDGMLIRVSDTLFTINMLMIREVVVIDEKQIIHDPDGWESVFVRKESITVLRLHHKFHLPAPPVQQKKHVLVVVSNGRTTIGLMADELLGQRQTVVKGLSQYFSALHCISGTAILSQGEIAFVLNTQALLTHI